MATSDHNAACRRHFLPAPGTAVALSGHFTPRTGCNQLIKAGPARTISAVTFSRARLRAHRDGRCLSRAGLAATAGLEPVALADIEEGRTDPPEGVVVRLAAALGVTRGDLVPTRGDWAEDYIEVVVTYLPTGGRRAIPAGR